MRFVFKPLPGRGLDVARPALQVAVVGPIEGRQLGLRPAYRYYRRTVEQWQGAVYLTGR